MEEHEKRIIAEAEMDHIIDEIPERDLEDEFEYYEPVKIRRGKMVILTRERIEEAKLEFFKRGGVIKRIMEVEDE